MKITEVIKELNKQKELHGDLDVFIYSTYNGNCYAGGNISKIEFQQNGDSPYIDLISNDVN